ncbi:MAG: bifunctional glutamate N-acetyltransferase/amino-acid acetyltransferase ArgJ [Treponema sp.]|nr:bifunctional glutamate N-acetyltransferase/amino-acid acetyltransferase ArgJ [Treponema sp.]
MVKFIQGGVTAANGFLANGIHSGLKASRKGNDTALVYSQSLCDAAGLFTSNKVKAECVKFTMQKIKGGKMQAAVCNVCFANACTGAEGYQTAEMTAQAVAKELKINADNVIVCSTGIIGQPIPRDVLLGHIPELAAGLSKDGNERARVAIMTTDTHYKECAVQTEIGGKTVTIGAMCKGSGMIHINMGTMLSFVTTDCAISSAMLQEALKEVVPATYNCVSVDGDTSTNDTITIMANGTAGNPRIEEKNEDWKIFVQALSALSEVMAKKIAADGEGASRLVECVVNGANDVKSARVLAKEVIASNLVKAAMFGRDANCGRILCAMGYSGADFDPDKTTVTFVSKEGSERYFEKPDQDLFEGGESVVVVKDGIGLAFDEEKATRILGRPAVQIVIDIKGGNATAKAWGCDLTYDYVKINGDYRS